MKREETLGGGSQGLTNKAEANEEDQCEERVLRLEKVFDRYFSL